MNISYLMRSTTLITFFLYMQILLLKITFFLDDVIYHSISPMIPLYCALQYTTISLKNLYVYFAGGANMRIIPRKIFEPLTFCGFIYAYIRCYCVYYPSQFFFLQLSALLKVQQNIHPQNYIFSRYIYSLKRNYRARLPFRIASNFVRRNLTMFSRRVFTS